MSGPINILAVPDAWTIGFPIGVFVLQVVNAVITAILAARAKEVHSLRESLQQSVREIVNQQFAHVLDKLRDHDDRLKGGHSHFDRVDRALQELAIADRELKLEVLKAIQDLRERVVTRDDLERWERK